MKRFSLLFVLLCVAVSVRAQGPPPTVRPGSGGLNVDLVNDDKIRALYTKFVDAFNRHDVEAVVGFFAEDGVFDKPVGPDVWGRRYVGKKEIRAEKRAENVAKKALLRPASSKVSPSPGPLKLASIVKAGIAESTAVSGG